MKTLTRYLNVFVWPLWLKLTAGFVVAVLLPAALIAVVLQTGFAQITGQNLESYISENGNRQREIISNDLSQAQNLLSVLVNAPEYSERLLRAAEDGSQDLTLIGDASEDLRTVLDGNDSFESIRLLDDQGLVLVEITDTSVLLVVRTESAAPAFIQATNALSQARNQSTTVFQNASRQVVVEMAQAVVDADGIAKGFVVGKLNVDTVLLDHLNFQNAAFPLYSYLATGGRNSLVLTAEEYQNQVDQVADDSPAVAAAFRNSEGETEHYNVGEGRQEVIGYYAPILNPANTNVTLFALVTEVRADAPIQQALAYFGAGRVFVIGIGSALVLAVLVVLFNQIITPPLVGLRRAIQAVAQGQFNEPVPGAGRGDEIGDLGAAFTDMRVQVRNLLDDLEARIATRTRDISATQEISRFAATQRNMQLLMDQVVQLIIERFPNIYHAQIFLLDKDRLYANLRASTGEVGAMLLGRGHRLAVGSISVIGQVVQQGEAVIARDTAASAVHRKNEFLPETRAELAIPLKSGDVIIGALDVQSKFRNAFAEDEIRILETMADQIAVAIENARLYQESLRRLDEIERNNRQKTLQTWQEYVYGRRQRQLSSEAGTPTGNDLSELRRKAVSMGKIAVGEITRNATVPIAVPIQLRGETLGAVEWELPAEGLNDNKLQLAQELANRLAVSLENARLFQESQKATERERIVNSIAARLTPQTEIDEILRTAVREVGQALRAPQVNIRLHRSNGNGNGNGNGHNGNDSE